MCDCNPLNDCIKNRTLAGCIWYGSIVTLFIFLMAGTYVFIPDNNSITGAVLLLIGALGLMCVAMLYVFRYILKPLLLPL